MDSPKESDFALLGAVLKSVLLGTFVTIDKSTPAERTDIKVNNHLYIKVSVRFKGDSSTLKKQAEFFTLHKISF